MRDWNGVILLSIGTVCGLALGGTAVALHLSQVIDWSAVGALGSFAAAAVAAGLGVWTHMRDRIVQRRQMKYAILRHGPALHRAAENLLEQLDGETPPSSVFLHIAWEHSEKAEFDEALDLLNLLWDSTALPETDIALAETAGQDHPFRECLARIAGIRAMLQPRIESARRSIEILSKPPSLIAAKTAATFLGSSFDRTEEIFSMLIGPVQQLHDMTLPSAQGIDPEQWPAADLGAPPQVEDGLEPEFDFELNPKDEKHGFSSR